MRSFLLLLLAACTASSLPESTDEAEIIGGIPFDPAQTYSVLLFTSTGGCSGTLLTHDWVLTAAHCFGRKDRFNPDTVLVRLGPQQTTAESIVVYPKYNPSGWGNGDVALVHLRFALAVDGQLSGHEMGLWTGFTEDLVGKQVTLHGFGRDSFGAGAGTLRKAIFVVDENLSGGDRFDIEENHDNAIGWEGDSGGGYFLDSEAGRTLVGVHSFCHGNPITSEVTSCEAMSVEGFRDWALETIFKTPQFPNRFERADPRTDRLKSPTNGNFPWDPCNGACYTWNARFDFETGFDFGFVDGVLLTGTGSQTGRTCGQTNVMVQTNGFNDSPGFSSLSAKCDAALQCLGPACISTPSPLPGVVSVARWTPCPRRCTRATIHHQLFPGGDMLFEPTLGGVTGFGTTPLDVCDSTSLTLLADPIVDSPGVSLATQCVESREVPGVSTAAEGAGLAVGDLDFDGIPDRVFLSYDDAAGGNEFRLVAENGRTGVRSRLRLPGVGAIADGAGAALTHLDTNDRPDLIVMAYDAPAGPNTFRYRVLKNVDADLRSNEPVSGIIQLPGLGDLAEGAGLAVGSIDADPRPDMVLMAYDDAPAGNEFRFWIVRNLDQDGVSKDLVEQRVPGFGVRADGAGVALGQLDTDPRPDLVLLAEDDPLGPNTFRGWVLFNLDENGKPERRSALSLPGLADYSEGADIAFNRGTTVHGDVLGDGTLMVMSHADDASPNPFRWRFVPRQALDF